ncbi:sugar ABC transporter substrate-binding protein [Clostridium oceanicum]|uniref:Sugar ABC transporter substrate-binding protein n=1 Tax=Clostridium oceanicum TaxID=1543 RepID=A0ABP3UUN2_9CLOT
MKSIKKKLALFLFIILTLGTLSACKSKSTSSNSDDGEKKHITVWLPPIGENDKPVWEPIFKEFEEKNNCKIDLELIPWENYPEKYATAIAAGKGPDVGYMYAEMFPKFIKMGAVEDLTKRLDKKDMENYIYIDDAKEMGGIYGLPIEAANPAMLYYNKDILEKIGEKPPKTWEDFRRIAKKATKDSNGDGKIDQWGFAQGWGQKFFGDLNWNWYGFLWQAGGELYNDDLKTIKFNDKAGVETAQFLKDLKFKDKVIPDNAMSKTNSEMFETLFAKGKAAFAINLSSKSSEVLEKSFKDLKYGMITSLENKGKGTFASVDQLTLMSSAKDKDLSFKLIKHMLSAKSMTKFHKYHPRAPITKDEPYQGDPKLKEMIKNDKGVYRPLKVAPHGVEVYDYLWKQLQKMMNGEVSPKEALDEAARYGNDLLKKDTK